ncbi:MAG: acyltransferase family protein [Lachnospiraceae bacterium]|nr:acyltransferase family protein [Lachnospiraceae bacterium]
MSTQKSTPATRAAGAVRIAKFDNIKLFLIFCVVLGHMIERFLTKSPSGARVQLWIYLFHMPAFAFLAGLFSKKTVIRRDLRRIFSFVLLYLFMEVLFYLSSAYVKGMENAVFDPLHEDGIPWFCLSMFWWYLLTLLTKEIRPAVSLPCAVLAAAAAGFAPPADGLLALLRTAVFYPFFLAGFHTDPRRLLTCLEKPALRAAGLCAAAGSLAACFLLYSRIGWTIDLFRGKLTYGQLGLTGASALLAGPLLRLLAMLVSAVLMLSVMAVIPSRRTFLSGLGSHTLAVYVLHGPVYSVILGTCEPVLRWIVQDHILLRCALLSVGIVAVTAPAGELLQTLQAFLRSRNVHSII